MIFATIAAVKADIVHSNPPPTTHTKIQTHTTAAEWLCQFAKAHFKG